MKALIGFISFLLCGLLVGSEGRVLLYSASKNRSNFASQDQKDHAFGLHYHCKKCLNKQSCFDVAVVVKSWSHPYRLAASSEVVVFDDEVDIDSNDIVKLWDDNSSNSGLSVIFESFLRLFQT